MNLSTPTQKLLLLNRLSSFLAVFQLLPPLDEFASAGQTISHKWWGSRKIPLEAPIPVAPQALLLPRVVLTCLLAARSGHRDFVAYHERFQHISATL